jgi:hypothetical protein
LSGARSVRPGCEHLFASPRDPIRAVQAGIKEDRCEECGVAEWRGRPLAVALRHVDGQPDGNRLVNLQVLCPDCHSQTPNFAGRNARQPREEVVAQPTAP